MATESKLDRVLGLFVRGSLWLIVGLGIAALVVGIVMLASGCSPRNRLISKMDTWGGEHGGGGSPRTEVGQCDVEGE